MIHGLMQPSATLAEEFGVADLANLKLVGGIRGVRSFLTEWDRLARIAGSGATETMRLSWFRAQLVSVDEFKEDLKAFRRLPADHRVRP